MSSFDRSVASDERCLLAHEPETVFRRGVPQRKTFEREHLFLIPFRIKNHGPSDVQVIGAEAPEIAIAGDSAGGGLSFALLLRLAQENLPKPACVVGFSPWVDMTGESKTLTSHAKRDVMLPANRLKDAVAFVLNGHDPTDPLASPLFGDWDSPPPTMIFASKHEILLNDSVHLAEHLRAAGGDVTLELWRHTPHAWPIFVGRLPEAQQTVQRAGAFIARHLDAE